VPIARASTRGRAVSTQGAPAASKQITWTCIFTDWSELICRPGQNGGSVRAAAVAERDRKRRVAKFPIADYECLSI
jgi:hypothetical protein